MSYADIDNLNLTAEPEVVTEDTYVAPKQQSFDPIQPSRGLTVKVVEGKFKQDGTDETNPIRLGATRNGYLSAEFTLQIQGGEYANRLLFHRLNTTPFRNGERQGMNMFLDFLVSVGAVSPADLTSNQSYVDALVGLLESGKTFSIDVDLEWFCNPNAQDYQGCGARQKYAKKSSYLDDNGKWATHIECNSPDHDGDAPVLAGRNIITNAKA